MTLRMKIAENFFRISKPGIDVTAATGLQLAFSEDMSGLIPADKGWITGVGAYPLPETGFVPIIYIVGGASFSISIVVNPGQSVFYVSGTFTAPIRYVIFKNRQF
jgi:hypothetical protein